MHRVSIRPILARVREIGLGMTSKKLEPMVIEKTMSHGNYFPMSAPGPYRIEVDIHRRGGHEKPITVVFEYSHPRR